MFKSLNWNIEKEEREKAIVALGSGALRIHIVYSAYRHVKNKKYYTLVNGPFGVVKNLGESASIEDAKKLAEQDYQKTFNEVLNMINSLKVGDLNEQYFSI